MAKIRNEKEKDNLTYTDYVKLENELWEDFSDNIDKYDVNDILENVPIDSFEYNKLEEGFYNHYLTANIDNNLKKINKIKGINVEYISK